MQGGSRLERKRGLVPVTVVHTRLRTGDGNGDGFKLVGAPFEDQDIDLEWILSKLSEEVPDDYETNRLFYDGDHWQDGDGWGGPRPEVNAQDGDLVMKQIERSFTSKNCIREVTGRKTNGVVGKEPSWHLTSRNAALENKVQEIMSREALSSGRQTQTQGALLSAQNGDAAVTEDQQRERALRIADLEDALTSWWDEHQVHTTLNMLVITACLAGRATLRIYVPPGRVNEGGALVNAGSTLRDALKNVFVHAPDVFEGAVIRDPATMRDLGVYYVKDDEQNEHAEIMYVNSDDITVVREVRVGDSGNVLDDEMQIDIGGRLLMCELRVPKLITDQVRQLQKLINKALTMGGENVNLAGFLERTILNGQLPGHTEEITYADGRKVKRFVRDKMELGGGAVNNIVGVPIFGPDNEFQGLATPSIVYRDPVGPEQFEKTVYMAYRALLEEVDQVHYLLSGEQYASGESRKQSRADFIASLRAARGAVNEVGRWLIETVLAYGTWLAGGGNAFEDLRAVFDARLDPGPATSDEINMAIQLNGVGGLSTPTMMAWSGVDDVDAEMLLVREERERANAAVVEQNGAAAAANGGGANNRKRNERRPPRGVVARNNGSQPEPAPQT